MQVTHTHTSLYAEANENDRIFSFRNVVPNKCHKLDTSTKGIRPGLEQMSLGAGLGPGKIELGKF